LEYALTFGADQPSDAEKFAAIMSDAAAYAADKGIKLVMKPHGGISGAAAEIRQVLDRVKHKNFSIWYDAGNIIYYTGKDPVVELEPIAEYVTGFCAKDCPAPKGDVMIQFGAGAVDFLGVFRRLQFAGFTGPVMVEGVKVGTTPDETTANARANREFLTQVFAAV
jgi:sugar phosphate isomerase/epimerase